MCGLIYVKSLQKRANKPTLKRYNKQSLRGSDGFGFCGLINGKLETYKRFQEEAEMTRAINESNADEILLHHRLPTSTVNLPEVNHPILIKQDKFNYYVTHNGIISNAKQLKTEHNLAGYKYSTELTEQTNWIIGAKTYASQKSTSFNDSEAFAWDLVLFLEGKQTTLKSQGSIAFICLVTDKQGKANSIYFGRNSANPLRYDLADDFFSLSSETGSQEVIADRLYMFDYKTAKISYSNLKIGFYQSYSSFGFTNSKTKTKDWEDDWSGDYYNKVMIDDELWQLEDELEEARATGNDDLVNYLVEEIASLKKQANVR